MQIKTSKGDVIIFDDADAELVLGRAWNLYPNGYAFRHVTLPDGRKTTRMMHRILMGLLPGDAREVDHKNGNRADNRRENLRLCDRRQNLHNKIKQSNNTSGFKGVSYHTQRHKWQARIKYNGKQKHLGLFETPELAHEFYCLAADMLFGEFASCGVR